MKVKRMLPGIFYTVVGIILLTGCGKMIQEKTLQKETQEATLQKEEEDIQETAIEDKKVKKETVKENKDNITGSIKGNKDKIADSIKESRDNIEDPMEEAIITAYTSILEEYKKNMTNPERPVRYGLIYLDDDATPELAVSTDNAHLTGIWLYSYIEGEALLLNVMNDNGITLDSFGCYGQFSYNEREGIIRDCYDRNFGQDILKQFIFGMWIKACMN